jgi:uncharacterized protein (DUF302 family)
MRYQIAILALICVLFSIHAFADTAVINVRSFHSVKETTDRLIGLLPKKGMTLFSTVDHAANARQADMELPPTTLVMFGKPAVGTPLMQCGRTIGVDLPQKALIWKDSKGAVWLSYNDPKYLAKRHQLEECPELVDRVEKALRSLAEAAAKPE